MWIGLLEALSEPSFLGVPGSAFWNPAPVEAPGGFGISGWRCRALPPPPVPNVFAPTPRPDHSAVVSRAAETVGGSPKAAERCGLEEQRDAGEVSQGLPPARNRENHRVQRRRPFHAKEATVSNPATANLSGILGGRRVLVTGAASGIGARSPRRASGPERRSCAPT